VLVALCRPYGDGSAYASPATNKAIAAELYLSVDAVKTHLRAIGEKLGADDLPQNVKRRWLVERALELGLVTRREL
jgi:DNA-binding NarL/FixJ family response regulator